MRRHFMIYLPAVIGGGAERVAAVLASRLAALGHQVTLAADFDAPENRAFVGPGVDYAVLNGWHHRETTRLARQLRKRQPDVVIAIGAISNLKLVLAHRLVRPKTRIVLSYHGHSNVGRGRLGALAYWFAPALTRAADATVCVSDDLIRHLADDWRVPPERLTRIHNPVAIDKTRPARTEAELRARPPLVLGMARLWPEKGFDTLIAAMGLLPDPAIRLVIYGEGPERKRLEALVGRLGLADRVSLPGYVPDPWQAYAEARCFALASNDEAFGNVVVEALASGLPVVATKSGGPEEILDHGRCGALVPPRDPAAMAAAIVRALRAPGDPGPRIERARTFDARAVATRYVALFEEVLTRA